MIRTALLGVAIAATTVAAQATHPGDTTGDATGDATHRAITTALGRLDVTPATVLRADSLVTVLRFDIDPATRLLDLQTRYEHLDKPESPLRIALAELRTLEARLRADNRLPRRYRPPADPPSLPALQT